MDKTQLTNMTTRQKAIAGVIVLIVLVVLWQIIGVFRGGSKRSSSATPSKGTVASSSSGQGGANMQPVVPQPGQITQQRMNDQQQSELIRLQQETQQKYVIALNELQMLKLSQQIAETNKDISAAKLATVTSEKNIVDLLTKPATPVETPASFSQGLNSAGGGAPIQQGISPVMPGAAVTTTTTTQTTTTTNYIVISVSKLLDKWSAVLGYQGKLYSINIGDVLPPDQSTVVGIDKYSVTLEKDGVIRKVSLVPII